MYVTSDFVTRTENMSRRHNISPSLASRTLKFLTKHNTTAVPQQLNSPDLAPCGIVPVPKVEILTENRRFHKVEEIEEISMQVIRHDRKHVSEIEKKIRRGVSRAEGNGVRATGLIMFRVSYILEKSSVSLSSVLVYITLCCSTLYYRMAVGGAVVCERWLNVTASGCMSVVPAVRRPGTRGS